MKVGFDTSVVLRLLVGEPISQAKAAVKYFQELREKGCRILVSDLVVTETYFALQHHYQTPKSEALAQLKTFLSTDGIENMGVASHVLNTPNLESAKPGFVDRTIHAQYADKAETVASFETAFRRLEKGLVLDA